MIFDKMNAEWAQAALIRMVRTIAQTALSMFSIGMAINEVEWFHIISVSVVAGVYSLLTSLTTKLPEATPQGVIEIDTTGEKDIYRLVLDDELDKLAKKDFVHLKINPEARLWSQPDETQ